MNDLNINFSLDVLLPVPVMSRDILDPGIDILCRYNPERQTEADTVERIFRAMLEAYLREVKKSYLVDFANLPSRKQQIVS